MHRAMRRSPRTRASPFRYSDENYRAFSSKRVFAVKKKKPAHKAVRRKKEHVDVKIVGVKSRHVFRYIRMCTLQAKTHHVRARGWEGFPILMMKPAQSNDFEVTTLETVDKKAVAKRYLVTAEEVRTAGVAKDEDFRLRHDKILANKRVCDLLRTHWKPGQIITVLDSPIGLTTEWIRDRIPIAADAFHVPNPDPKFGKVSDGCTWYQKTMYEYLRDTLVEPTHFWLDYCCSLTGNSETKPMLDIEMILLKEFLPKKGGVLCITLSTRAGRSSGFEAWLKKLAVHYGYRLKREFEPMSYKSVALFGFISV